MKRRRLRAAQLERIAERLAYRKWLEFIVGRWCRMDLAERALRGDRIHIDCGSNVSRC